jgi:hypothetical protein
MFANGNTPAEVLLADEKTWNQFIAQVGQGWKPPQQAGMDTKTPFVANGQSWDRTISAVLGELDPQRHYIRYIKIMGHGAGGEFTCGVTLRSTDVAAINEFKRLQAYCSPAVTVVQILGCEAAADGVCVPGTVASAPGKALCIGPFSGDTSKPGYLLLQRIADAINAPVLASPWKQAFSDNRNGWGVSGARVTVGPGGSWTYDPAGANGQTKIQYGSP